MLKLIASDIDGTLLPYGQTALDPELFTLIRKLQNQGVLFCPASGRPFHSLRQLFAPVAGEICYICENGCVVYGTGTEENAPVLFLQNMPKADALALSRDIIQIPDCEVMICLKNGCYFCTDNREFVRAMRAAGYLSWVIHRLEDFPENLEIIKVSAYCPQGTDEPAQILGSKWAQKYQMAVAGYDWLDFTVSDKGTGLRGLCATLGINLTDVMAFGDNWNDLRMLEAAGTPWIMSNADPILQERFPNHCDSVTAILRRTLETLQTQK